ERRRPASPVPAMDLREGTEGGIVRQPAALRVTVAVEFDGWLRGGEKLLQGLHLQVEDPVSLDKPPPVQIVPCAHEPRQPLAEPGSTWYPLHPDGQRVAVSPARGVVGAGLLRQERQGRSQRIDQEMPSAQSGRPARQPAKIAQVAKAPALAGAECIELHSPAPGTETCRQVTAPGADDE